MTEQAQEEPTIIEEEQAPNTTSEKSNATSSSSPITTSSSDLKNSGLVIPTTKKSAAYEEKEFMYPELTEEEAPSDFSSMLSLFCGVLGLMLKMKYVSWLGALFCISGLYNLKYSEMDFKQTATSVMFSVMGLIMNYFGPAAHQP
ncbi:hypothetical protein C9374_006231 [Naegleria lovaniensis]|uniref:Protein Asterix n=1 Tax=Naegleria lovaniensis TaxID=51637 RepID=A0AA88GJC5_NAELO|nr:uncharacterized protein C9374_008309 [Naegleria lovaniensis]XP_044547526.1 uncharacterized protein C9374_006231 [Naegleria lovaniensis]KAG2378422.1 hypothetical protein C9374_008309 [Naegleria lovaniensis]KAG2381847.1 hypothetical protein C9374_006231 [Naegleria lovaniensis]